MAKIVFISVFDINTEGIRMLSSILRENEHDPYIVFLKRLKKGPVMHPETDWIGIGENGIPFQHAGGSCISDKEIDILISVIRTINPDIIGFSVTSPIAPLVKVLSKKIRQFDTVPILWGGPHATIWPKDCVDYCDFLCTGEADSLILKIANCIDNGENLTNLKGLTYTNQKILNKQPADLTKNLDQLPFKDISPKQKFLIDNNHLLENFAEISYDKAYHLISSRGCPYRCAYCGEDVFKKLYSDHFFLRRKSPENVILEIKKALEITNFQTIHFEDETFSFNLPWLESFCTQYKREIGLPFNCYIFPNKGTKEHIQLLINSGLKSTVLSLQSGSKYINHKIFKRPFDRDFFFGLR